MIFLFRPIRIKQHNRNLSAKLRCETDKIYFFTAANGTLVAIMIFNFSYTKRGKSTWNNRMHSHHKNVLWINRESGENVWKNPMSYCVDFFRWNGFFRYMRERVSNPVNSSLLWIYKLRLDCFFRELYRWWKLGGFKHRMSHKSTLRSYATLTRRIRAFPPSRVALNSSHFSTIFSPYNYSITSTKMI